MARYGSRMASMTAENEIVMVGGISQSTGEVFSTMKVTQSFQQNCSLPIIFFHTNRFFSFKHCKVLNSSLNEWTEGSRFFGAPVYDAIVLPVPKKILKSCEFGPAEMRWFFSIAMIGIDLKFGNKHFEIFFKHTSIKFENKFGKIILSCSLNHPNSSKANEFHTLPLLTMLKKKYLKKLGSVMIYRSCCFLWD